MLPLKSTELRPPSKNRVHFDHHHQHKNQINRAAHLKQVNFGLHTVNCDSLHKNKSLSIPALKPNQIRSLTQKSSKFRRHYRNQVISIPALKASQFRCLHTKTKLISIHTLETKYFFQPPPKKQVNCDPYTEVMLTSILTTKSRQFRPPTQKQSQFACSH